MAFPLFFLLSSALLLISVLFVIRNRDSVLRSFGVAASLTTLLLLAGAVVRLVERTGRGVTGDLLIDALTVANLSATAVLLVVWTARLRS